MQGLRIEISGELGPILGTIFALLVFGFAFNWIVLVLHKRGYSEGYTSLLVVIGTAITLLLSGFTIGWPAVLLLLIYFAASGLPMVIGDIYRYVNAREKE